MNASDRDIFIFRWRFSCGNSLIGLASFEWSLITILSAFREILNDLSFFLPGRCLSILPGQNRVKKTIERQSPPKINVNSARAASVYFFFLRKYNLSADHAYICVRTYVENYFGEKYKRSGLKDGRRTMYVRSDLK